MGFKWGYIDFVSSGRKMWDLNNKNALGLAVLQQGLCIKLRIEGGRK